MPNYPIWLSYAQENGLRDIDVAFGRFLYDINNSNDTALVLAVLCSYQLSNSNPCLNLDDFLANPKEFLPYAWLDYLEDTKDITKNILDCIKIDKNLLISNLLQSGYIGVSTDNKPLALVHNNLYLRRYWQAAYNIAYGINNLIQESLIKKDDIESYANLLNYAFADVDKYADLNWQKIACATALNKRLTIITGGPGTGKTTTVVRLLSLLQAIALKNGKPLRIRLAAPTGKAAARLNESISNALNNLDFKQNSTLQQALDLVPSTVTTLHRLLGARLNSRRFRHDENNLLDLDALVIDEASMMDIEIFDAVFKALPSHARLIILGDKDQLASVEAGAILGELCARSAKAYYTGHHAKLVNQLTGQQIPPNLLDENGTKLDQAIVMLRKSYRFHADSGIGKLATAINNTNINKVHDLIKHPSADLQFIKPTNQQDNWSRFLFDDNGLPSLFKYIKSHQPDNNSTNKEIDDYAKQVLQNQTKLQILCALRNGPWGTVGINQLVENKLNALGLIPKNNNWYLGRPVMVLRNRPDLGLANGDIGVTLQIPDGAHKNITLVAFTNSTNGEVLWLSPSRLDQIETVYALTVHKSQGSEFKHAVLVLPNEFSPVVTKELLYTGVTRAKNKLSLIIPGGLKVLETAIKSPTKRSKALISI